MKILYVATSDIHIKTFHIPYLKWLKEHGCETHLVIENRGNLTIPYADEVFYLLFPRKPFSVINVTSYRRLKAIINENNYTIVHCHTPIPGALTRLASRKVRKKGTKVIYTVHGFHFFKGASLMNWMVYYPIEYLLSAFTDILVTMNQEDFNYINGKMLHKESYFIPGVGVDPKLYFPYSNHRKIIEREKLGLSKSDFILLYVAEFIERKNHKMIINAISLLKCKIPNLKVLFAGQGILFEKVKGYAEKKLLQDKIEFLGFRNDINVLSAIADVGISASRQEGLPIGLLQEMFCSKPIVAPYERGHNELIAHGENGFLFKQNDVKVFSEYILRLYYDKALRVQMGLKSLSIANKFSIENSLKAMSDLYLRYIQ